MRNSKSYNKKDDRKHDHCKKKSDEAMHNGQFSSLSTANSSGKRSQSQSPSLSCSCLRSCSCSCSCSSSRSYKNQHVELHDRKPSAGPKRGVCTPRTMMTDITVARTKAIAFTLPSLLQRQREIIPPRNWESCQQSMNSHVQIRMINTNSHVRIHMSHYVSLFQ